MVSSRIKKGPSANFPVCRRKRKICPLFTEKKSYEKLLWQHRNPGLDF